MGGTNSKTVNTKNFTGQQKSQYCFTAVLFQLPRSSQKTRYDEVMYLLLYLNNEIVIAAMIFFRTVSRRLEHQMRNLHH